MDTDELAVSFLQNFIDVPESELVEMAITQCLSDPVSYTHLTLPTTPYV